MKINPKEVSYSDLLLDPQNPRLATCFSENDGLDVSDPISCQAAIEDRFKVPHERSDVQREIERLVSADEKSDDEESENDFFSIKDLKDSMRSIGFVGIQNIIVRKHEPTGKYIVLEGNRRLAAIRAVLREHENAMVGSAGFIDDEAILKSLQSIQVMVFDTKNRNEEVIRNEISTMLGLRHYGSQLNWELLPRAKNIHDEYMRFLDADKFTYTDSIAKRVADTLAIKRPEVKKLLRGYICYKQLVGNYPIKPHHFSLLLAAVENPNLQMKGSEYFEIDSKTFELGDDTAEKIDNICEFGDRDLSDFEKAIKDPKQFRKLGQLFKDSMAPEDSVRLMATRLFAEVIAKESPLDDVYTQLLAYKKRLNWVTELRKLLDRQSADQVKNGDLAIERFIGQGQQRKYLEDISRLLRRFMLLIDDLPGAGAD